MSTFTGPQLSPVCSLRRGGSVGASFRSICFLYSLNFSAAFSALSTEWMSRSALLRTSAASLAILEALAALTCAEIW